MASYKSHYIPPKRTEDQTPYSYRAPTTRLPQRSVTPTTTSSQVPTSGPSKLQKRRPARDEQLQSNRELAGQKAPTPKAPIGPVSRQGGVAPTLPRTYPAPRLTAPKFSSQKSSSRLPKVEASLTSSTPSLVSGSSVSTFESPRSNLLRRKESSIGVGSAKQTGQEDLMSSHERLVLHGIPGGYKDPFSETVLGISLPSTSTEVDMGYSRSPYDQLELGPTDVLPPPAPHYTLSTTPSTRYSESPGPFSVASTPTSMSSYSPGVPVATKPIIRSRQVSPLQARTPVARYRTPEERALPHHRDLPSASSVATLPSESAKPTGSQPREQMSAPTSGLPRPRLQADMRRPSNSAAEKPKVQAPPEFAHLADAPPSTAALRRPSRPSRDGTPDMTGFRGPSPIVQSNMTSFPSHRRTSSAGSTTSVAMNSKTRFGLPSKQSSRNPSPNPSQTSLPIPASRTASRGQTPDLQLEKKRSQTLPTTGPAPSANKPSRFGFFTRRTKTEPVAPVTKPEKKHRRGPAAGTGHEGYGRYAIKTRNGSVTGTSSIGRSASAATTSESLDKAPSTRKSSVTSTTSTEMDDFFLDRLNPVVIRGNGSSTELSRSPDPLQSTSSLDVSATAALQPPMSLKNPSQTSVNSNRPTLLPSAMADTARGRSPVKKMPLGLRQPSESGDEGKKSFIPSLGARRTSRITKDAASPPKNTLVKSRKGSISEGKETTKAAKKEKSDESSSKPPRKWNFFQRAHAAPRVPTPAVETSASPARAPASRSMAHYAIISTQSGLDEQDIEAIMNEADYTHEEVPVAQEQSLNDEKPKAEHTPDRLQSMLLPPKPILPPDFVPPARSESPKVYLQSKHEMQSEKDLTCRGQEENLTPSAISIGKDLEYNQAQAQEPCSESALSVSRLDFGLGPACTVLREQPKLTLDTSVTERSHPAPPSLADLTPVTDLSACSSPVSPHSTVGPLETIVSPKSMPAPVPSTLPSANPPPQQSLPPRPSRLAQVGRIPQVVSSRPQGHRPASRSFSRPFAPHQPSPGSSPRTNFDSLGALATIARPAEPFPVLRGLNALTQGTAIATIMPASDDAHRQSEFFKMAPRKGSDVSYSSSSGTWSFPATIGTAILPEMGSPQSEDEVWNEYNDLIDEVLSPIDTQTVGDGTTPTRSSLEPAPLRLKHTRISSHSAASVSAVSNPSFHLRRSRLLAVLHSQSPTSSVSLSEFLQEYGERNISVIDPITGRLSFPSTAHMSMVSGPGDRASSNRSSLPASINLSSRQSKATITSNSDKDRNSSSTNRYRDTRLMEMAENQTDGLSSMVNLRFGALMTSKWLSFGRVIFSPAHFEMNNPEHDRVLVIDGLGKDWSYYCALTYPEATIYNLGPGQSSSTPTAASSPEPWSTLKNHRHINHTSLSEAFPFPKGFFACVVLRFPSALPTSVHRAVISESKRVLRPGGYLELSVLDLDLVNMGNRARRAVRGLKVKMQVADENVSLRNISDEIMGLVGRKGFTECNRCFVGVPVAGQLPAPQETQSDTRKGSIGSVGKTGGKQSKPAVSFSDILNNRASSESTDNSITDMVARVGRWWYSRCYESMVLPEAGEPGAAESGDLLQSSIWRDENLLRECEKRGTSFRLLIGYAQKPEIGVRRTVSV